MMLERLQSFWDFFIYPLTVIDKMGMISDVLLMSLIVFSVFYFIGRIFEWCFSLKR